MTTSHCCRFNTSVLKKLLKKGRYITASCIRDEIITAPTRYRLLKGDNSQKECSSERQLKTKNNWEKTRVEKAMVRAVFKSRPSLKIPIKKARIVLIPISTPSLMIWPTIPRDKIFSPGFLGFFFIKSSLSSSKPRASAGKPSVTRLTHRI